MKTYDVAVIGSGLSGLFAANALADAGKTVVVIEKSDHVGGRAITVRKGSARFNLGAHALYRDGEAYAMIEKLGIKLNGNPPGTRFSAIWMDQVHAFPGNPVQLLASPLLTWAGKMELGRWMLRISKLDSSQLATTSLRDWTERQIRDPMVRHILYAVYRTSTCVHDPDQAAADPVLRQIQRFLKGGVQYLDGGWQTMVDQLRDRAERSGVVFLTTKRVVGINHDACVRGLLFADGETMRTPCVLSTVPPATLHAWVKDADHTVIRRWRDDARPALAACLDLSLKRLPVTGRNVALGLDQPVFFTNQSAVARLSDDGSHVMHVLKYNGAEPGDPDGDRQLLEHTMNLLHPGWKDELVTLQFLPNMTAYLLLLQQLSWAERAVFLLREVLQYDYDDIAEIVGKSSANCRQIFRRAKRSLGDHGAPHLDAEPITQTATKGDGQTQRVVEQFATALVSGNMGQLLNILTTGATLYSDGGGKVTAALLPIQGADRVARFLTGVLQKAPGVLSYRFAMVSGQPGVVAYMDGRVLNVVTFKVEAHHIAAVYIVINPDKLRHVTLSP